MAGVHDLGCHGTSVGGGGIHPYFAEHWGDFNLSVVFRCQHMAYGYAFNTTE
jgi:hypothetical protein